MQDSIQDQIFTKELLLEKPLSKGAYENCSFNNIDLSNLNFSDFRFIDCTFNGCNLSLTKLNKTGLQDVKFVGCKMLGLHFDAVNDFGLGISFENCMLNHSSFYKKKLKKIVFKSCSLQECDFSQCDLTAAHFQDCDLLTATFDDTILEKTDFRTAYNYTLDPERNRVKKARFFTNGLAGLLQKYDIIVD
ncbi:MAG: pentapeptide repeat-containing protein [Pedobacter sp.]|nr:MAG: pentapeptide repeat-containing protein [Pedobacter sp.]